MKYVYTVSEKCVHLKSLLNTKSLSYSFTYTCTHSHTERTSVVLLDMISKSDEWNKTVTINEHKINLLKVKKWIKKKEEKIQLITVLYQLYIFYTMLSVSVSLLNSEILQAPGGMKRSSLKNSLLELDLFISFLLVKEMQW